MTRVRMDPVARGDQLLGAAVDVAVARGLMAVTRVSVAEHAGVTAGLINRYFAGREGLRIAVIQLAVEAKNPKLVAEAVSAGYEVDLSASSRNFQREVKRLAA